MTQLGDGVRYGIAVALSVLTLAGCARAPEVPSPPSLTGAVEACHLESNEFVHLGDDGQTLTFEAQPGDFFEGAGKLADEKRDCLFSRLNVPDSIIQKMLATRAIDGMVSDEWDSFEATWTFHPDNGLRVIIETAG